MAKIPRNETVPDQWEAQIFSRILYKHTVIMVTDMCDGKTIESMHMLHASTFDEALKKAYELKGEDAKVVVIPDGLSVIVD